MKMSCLTMSMAMFRKMMTERIYMIENNWDCQTKEYIVLRLIVNWFVTQPRHAYTQIENFNSACLTDQINKSQNAPVPYPRIPHSEHKCAHSCSVSEHISVLNGVLWCIGQVHDGICEIGLLWWFVLLPFWWKLTVGNRVKSMLGIW